MNCKTILITTLLLVASVHGGSRRLRRSSGKVADAGTNIHMEGVSSAEGQGWGTATHDSLITVVGTPPGWTPSTPGGWNQPEVPGGWVPGLPATLNLNTGSGNSIYQDASNFQQSIINADGSSSAYQGNSASQSVNSYDYLSADAEGSQIDVVNNGSSDTSGSGSVVQADLLDHTVV